MLGNGTVVINQIAHYEVPAHFGAKVVVIGKGKAATDTKEWILRHRGYHDIIHYQRKERISESTLQEIVCSFDFPGVQRSTSYLQQTPGSAQGHQ